MFLYSISFIVGHIKDISHIYADTIYASPFKKNIKNHTLLNKNLQLRISLVYIKHNLERKISTIKKKCKYQKQKKNK
ncbi:hypothetical protein HanIR_Chr04g0152911 [Helianthus annuus]|nr:hypothetical protein HanIR_Chr04g0152911 [Helianthus annuus]